MSLAHIRNEAFHRLPVGQDFVESLSWFRMPSGEQPCLYEEPRLAIGKDASIPVEGWLRSEAFHQPALGRIAPIVMESFGLLSGIMPLFLWKDGTVRPCRHGEPRLALRNDASVSVEGCRHGKAFHLLAVR